MRKSEELYEVIHAMTGSEKRFFKIYCSRHEVGGKNNYVQLFDLFLSQKNYNETKLRQKIEEAPFVKHVAAEQNYLYQMVLETLDIYHKESSVDKQITKLTNIARVLANKKLEEQSIKILDKAFDLAESHSRFASQIPIYELAKRKHFSQDSITTEKLAELNGLMETTLHRLVRSHHYQKIFNELMLLRRKIGYVINDQILAKVQSIFPDAEAADPTDFSSFDEEVFFFLCKMEYFRLVHKGKAGLYYTKHLIKLFEGNLKNLSGVYIDHYIYALNVFIVARMYEDESEARATLEKVYHLDKVISKNDNTVYVKAKVFEVYYTCVTDLALKSGDYHEILANIKEIEKQYYEVEKHMTPTFSMVLQANLALVFFNAGHYKTALKWCHALVNEAPKLREDIYYIMRILYLMIHFELENELILPSLIQSTYRYLDKKNRVSQFETIFIKHLRAQLRTDDKTEKRSLYQNLKAEIIPLKNNPYENFAMQEIDVIGWIDRKLKVLA